MASEQGVRIERSEIDGSQIATVWLDRPERMNALSPEMWDGLAKAFVALRDQPEVRLVLLRSTCEKAFCAGLDLGGGGVGPDGLRAMVRRYHKIFDDLEDHPAPVVAVLHGHVLGGGLEMAMSCDIRIAADDVMLGLTEAKVGLIPADGGTQRLAKYVGLGRAKYMILTGEKVNATRALEWGLVEEVVPRAGLDEAVTVLAQKLVRAAPLSQRHCKSLVRRSFELPREGGGDAEADAVVALSTSRDLIEGMKAFMQKRPPKWRGQ
jgi:enoyl-CoA hydratase/carnithine racemase